MSDHRDDQNGVESRLEGGGRLPSWANINIPGLLFAWGYGGAAASMAVYLFITFLYLTCRKFELLEQSDPMYEVLLGGFILFMNLTAGLILVGALFHYLLEWHRRKR